MSRRVQIDDEFDDETDLPLPSHPLPNTGARGPILQQLGAEADDDDDGDVDNDAPGPTPSASSGLPDLSSLHLDQKSTVTDITPYKSWTCIYPIYIDAKRPYATGQRRVQRAKSIWWPLSKDIADAATALGFSVLHEVSKAHPRDWENPGRVRIQWKKDGRLVNPVVKTKKQLLEMICFHIQHLKPENIPKAPYTLALPPTPSVNALAKGKQSGKSKSAPTAPSPRRQGARRLPVPPEPLPPLANRVSPYSPIISPGILIEAVKAGMNATESAGAPGAPGASGAPAGTQKGKRKVIRVRG